MEPIDFQITSGVTLDGAPIVQILIHSADWSITIRPDDARQLAHNLLHAAEAAIGDSFFLQFFRTFNISDQQIAAALEHFRAQRNQSS